MAGVWKSIAAIRLVEGFILTVGEVAGIPGADAAGSAVTPGINAIGKLALFRGVALIREVRCSSFVQQGEMAIPLDAITPAMGEESGGKIDRVAPLEPVFTEQFRWQFHGGDVPKISVQTRAVHQANGWSINDRLDTGANAGANGIGRTTQEEVPLGAVARAHDFVPVEDVLDDILRVQSKVNRPPVPAHVQVGQGQFRDWFDVTSLTVP